MRFMQPGAAAMLARGDRSAAHSVRLAGRELGTQVQSWSLDRSYATDLPDAMRAFSGSSSAELDVSLAGTAGQPAPALYGPWAPRATGDITRPGQSAVLGWGVGGFPLAQFRGTVRARSGRSGTDSVRVTALDGADRLRQPARLPRPDGVLANTLSAGQVGPWTASPVWVVDHLLRQGGLHTCPPPRSGSILYASLHGGTAANTGYLESTSGAWSGWTKTNVPFECAADGGQYPWSADYIPRLKPVNRRSDGMWFEFWVNTEGNMAADPFVRLHTTWQANGLNRYYVTMEVNFATAKITVWNGTNPDHTQNQSLQWTHDQLKNQWGLYHIGWWLTWSAEGVPTLSPVITNRFGVVQTFGDAALSATPVPPGALDVVRFTMQNLRAECFQVSQMASKPSTYALITQSGSWQRGAVLDVPRLPLATIPRAEGSAWDVITEIAKATLATAEFNSDGYFRWKDHTRWASPPTEANLTVSSARELAGLTISEEIDACRNYVAVKWANWARVKSGTDGHLWIGDSGGGIPIAPGATISRAIPIGEDRWDARTPNTYLDTLPDCVSITTTAAGSTAAYGVVEVGTTRDGGTVTLTMRNRGTTTVYYQGTTLYARTAGSAGPSGPTDAFATAQNRASQSVYGIQTYEHPGGGWVQYRDTAAELAESVLKAGEYPIPSLQSVEILADPRLELGDVVRVVDSTGAALNTLAWVVGIKTNGEDGRITQVLTLRGTKSNGAPVDAGLVPDLPVNPGVGPPQ